MGIYLVDKVKNESIPLKKFHYYVEILNNLCEITILQEFENKTEGLLDTMFIFPIDTEMVVKRLIC